MGPKMGPKMGTQLVQKLLILGSIFGSLFLEALELFGCLFEALDWPLGLILPPSRADPSPKWPQKLTQKLSEKLSKIGPDFEQFLELFWGHFGAQERWPSGSSFFKVFWSPILAPFWPHLGPILAPFWLYLGPSWPLLAPSWPHLGPILAHFGLSWRPLGAVLAPILASSCAISPSPWPCLGSLWP